MIAHIKEKWVAALRSGKFQQERARLRGEEGHCCALGVLCEVLDLEKVQLHTGHGGRVYLGYQDDVPKGLLPPSVLARVGMDPLDAVDVASMNDISRQSFTEIADFIEENL